MKVIELNRPAVAKAIHSKDLSIKVYMTSYTFKDRKGLIAQATAKAPVYRYAKNFGEKPTFSLIMVSKEKDTKKIESFFEEISQEASKLPIQSNGYTYLETYFGDKK